MTKPAIALSAAARIVLPFKLGDGFRQIDVLHVQILIGRINWQVWIISTLNDVENPPDPEQRSGSTVALKPSCWQVTPA
jgi:hypothetical protein